MQANIVKEGFEGNLFQAFNVYLDKNTYLTGELFFSANLVASSLSSVVYLMPRIAILLSEVCVKDRAGFLSGTPAGRMNI